MYRGHSLYGDPHPDVVVSYDLTTIHANRVLFNRKSLRFKAEGNIIIEQGGERTCSKRVEVDFNVAKPILMLIDR